MKILLIQPPIEDFYTTPIRLYPLGLLYAAGTLQKLGCRVDILDCLTPPKKRRFPVPKDFSYLTPYLKNSPYMFKGYYRFGLTDRQIMQRIREVQPDMIGISSQFTAYFSSVQKLAEMIKTEIDAPIFIGGAHAAAFGEEIKKRTTAIDEVLIGPAETALPRYFNQIDASRFSGDPIDWKAMHPAHELLRAEDYRMGRKNYLSLVASRGCPYKCEFCSVHNMFGRRTDYRDIDDVLEEMRRNVLEKETRIFNFEDDNISVNKKWFESFLQRVISDSTLKDIELTALNGLCYPTLDEHLVQLMYRAGFRRLYLSFVTQDEALRRRLQRPERDDNLERIVRTAQKFGFFITVYIIIGLPGQSYDEVKKSIDYLLGLNVLVGPSVFYIPPASPLYDKLDLPEDIRCNWNMYRSSAFAVETDELNREQLLDLFSYTREQNLLRKPELWRKA